MAITICGDRIILGDYILCNDATNGGVYFSGKACAGGFPSTWTYYGGDSCGYSSGGSPTGQTCITFFTFASGNDAAQAPISLSQGRYALTGGSNKASGQAVSMAGYNSGEKTTVDLWPFAFGSPASNVGQLNKGRYMAACADTMVYGKSYIQGSGNYPNPLVLCRESYTYSSGTICTDAGSMQICRLQMTGQSSLTCGYSSLGWCTPAGTTLSTVEGFPFASEGPRTSTGQLTQARRRMAGQSSADCGYASGGRFPSPAYNTIDKFSFANENTCANSGSLPSGAENSHGMSSTTCGYMSYGNLCAFPFASDAGGSCVGGWLSASYGTGHQV